MIAVTLSAAPLLKKLKTFDWERWNASLGKDLWQPYRDLVVTSGQAAATALGAVLDLKDPMLAKFMTTYVLERATQLNATTKADLTDLIQRALAEGDTKDLSERVLASMREKFSGYEAWRAEHIARAETAIGFNQANVLGFSQAGVTEVEVVDGMGDDACAEADGQTWTLRESLADPIAHPNCVRSFVPVIPDLSNAETLPLGYERLLLDDDLPYLCALVAEYVTSLTDPCPDRVLDAIEDEERHDHEAF